MKPKITAVIVTYNRLSKLQKTLANIQTQTRLPDNVIVIDNHSTDGTSAFLANWAQAAEEYHKEVITLPSNLGGAGGFREGIRAASSTDCDWIYVCDDDAYPDLSLFREFVSLFEQGRVDQSVAVVASTIFEHGAIAYNHRRHLKKSPIRIREFPSSDGDYEKNIFACEIFSFVGAFISKESLSVVGLPREDFFIRFDDTEYAYRFYEHGLKVLCCSDLKVFHDPDPEVVSEDALGWKDYYVWRNHTVLSKLHHPWPQLLKGKLSLRFKALRQRLKGNKKWSRLYLDALNDAMKDRMGVSELYRPGTKVAKK